MEDTRLNAEAEKRGKSQLCALLRSTAATIIIGVGIDNTQTYNNVINKARELFYAVTNCHWEYEPIPLESNLSREITPSELFAYSRHLADRTVLLERDNLGENLSRLLPDAANHLQELRSSLPSMLPVMSTAKSWQTRLRRRLLGDSCGASVPLISRPSAKSTVSPQTTTMIVGVSSLPY